MTGTDGLTQDFTVTVSVPAITAYSFQVAQNAGLAATSLGTITGASIAVGVPPGTNVTGLVATFTTTNASVTVGGVAQTSAASPHDFTNPVIYTVTAADGTTQDFTVTVTVLLTSFSFTGAVGNEATFPADGVNPGLAAIPVMSRARGTPTAAAGAFSGSGWNTAALDATHFYTFTVVPTSGASMTLTNLALKDQRSGTGPVTFAVRSSRDGFSVNLQTFASHLSLGRSDIVLGAAFANLTAPIELRLYAFGASASAGTWRIDDVQLTGAIVP